MAKSKYKKVCILCENYGSELDKNIMLFDTHSQKVEMMSTFNLRMCSISKKCVERKGSCSKFKISRKLLHRCGMDKKRQLLNAYLEL